jgi:hypothetical protein
MLEAYALPHECEREGLATILAQLDARQRRVLRAYMWQVELGEKSVTEWLALDSCPISRSKWYEATERGRYWGNKRFQAALDAYRKAGLEWQMNQERRAVEAAQKRIRRAAPAAADRLVDQVDADLSAFFKVVERWTTEPLPSQEIVEERDVEVEEHGEMVRVHQWRVKATVVDLEKLTDSRYSRMVKTFTDSPKSGLKIELHDALKAAESVLDRADKATASKGETTAIVDMGRFEDALKRAYGDDDAE